MRLFFVRTQALGFIECKSCLGSLLWAEGCPIGHAFVQHGLVFARKFVEIIRNGQPLALLGWADLSPK